jgi:Tol biopolymer transport system component
VGDPTVLVESIPSGGAPGAGAAGRFSVSQTGLLVYWVPFFTPAQLTWLDRKGRPLSTLGEPGRLSTMALSPDGQRVAYGRRDSTGALQNIWVADLARGVSSRLTFGALDSDAAWSPDGNEIAFASVRGGRKSLYAMSSTGGAERPLLASTGPQLSMDAWSPDGQFVLYHVATTRELMALRLSGQPELISVVKPNTGIVDEPAFSPDGRCVAYNTNDTGRHEVYIKSFPPTDGRLQISVSGGVQPRWRGDGRELFYLTPDGTMMVVDIRAGVKSKRVYRELCSRPV